MPRGRKHGSKNVPSREEKLVRRVLQQRDWHLEGRCIVCGDQHDENWHAILRAEAKEREAMLRMIEEGE